MTALTTTPAWGLPPLAQGMLGDQGVEFGDELCVTSHGQLDVNPLLRERQPKLVEVNDVRPGKVVGGEVGEGWATPQPLRRCEVCQRQREIPDGYSGADLAHICESAAERAMMEGIRSGAVRMIQMDDLYAALREVRPSTGPWFDAARNVVQFANTDGTYDELRTYMKRTKKL